MLRIPTPILDDMVAHAREVAPFECCGLLAGLGSEVVQQYRITNAVARDQQAVRLFQEMKTKSLEPLSARQREEVAYFMDVKEQARAQKDWQNRGLDLLVVYHSHPASPAYPSGTDISLAQAPLTFYPQLVFAIISLLTDPPDIRTYRISDSQVHPIPLTRL